jgi:chromate transporter
MTFEEHSFRNEEPLIEGYLEVGELTWISLCEISIKLGLFSFGGPIAHQEDIKNCFVTNKKLLTNKQFKHILNFCLVLPGYSSSTLLAAIVAIKKKSLLAGLISLILFCLPSMIMTLFLSVSIKNFKDQIHSQIIDYKPEIAYFDFRNQPWLYITVIACSGISQASLGLMLNAAFTLIKKLSNTSFQMSILCFSAITYFLMPNFLIMVFVMIICGLFSSIKGDHDYLLDPTEIMLFKKQVSKIKLAGLPCLIIFFLIYTLIHIIEYLTNNVYFILFENFFRIGALSFSEGHVIIPMIVTEYASKNLIQEWEVLDGYALVSLLPGSMFNLAGYTGVICENIFGGLMSNIAIFMPGFLFVLAALPFMDRIKSSHFLQFFIRGVSSATIGFLIVAGFHLWYDICIKNPYTNYIIGTLNILMCFMLAEAFNLHKPYIIIAGSIFLLCYTYLKLFFAKSIY